MVTGRTKVALVLGSLLTLGGIVYAQAVDSQYRANDGIDSTPSIVPFSDDDSINLKKILGTGGTFDFIDPVVWLQGKLNFLEENGPRVRKHFTPTLRQIRIRDTMKLLAQVRNEKEKRDVGYFNSQRNLEGEVKNGEFIPKGLETGVTYAIVERWPGNVEYPKGADVAILFSVKKAPKIQEVESLQIMQSNNNYPLPPSKAEESEKSIPLSFIGGVNYSSDNRIPGFAGFNLGVRLGNNEDLVNLALLLDYQRAISDKTLISTNPTSPAGISGFNTISWTGLQSIGFDVSLYLGGEKAKGVIGAGYHRISGTETDTAQIFKGTVLQNSSSLSSSILEDRLRLYGGGDIKAGNSRYELDAGIELSNSKKINAFVTFRDSFNPPSRYNKDR